MGYTFEGILTNLQTGNKLKEKYNTTVIIELHKDVVMIPLTDELYDEIHLGKNPKNNTSIRNFTNLTPALEQLCHELSHHNKLAFIEAEYFGGMGTQNGIVWEQGQMILEETETDAAINHSLASLGVMRSEHQDEFNTVGLGRHRSVEDWVRGII